MQRGRDVVARHLRDCRRLGLDAHLAVLLRDIARTLALNGIQNAMLNVYLNADGLEAMPPAMNPFILAAKSNL